MWKLSVAICTLLLVAGQGRLQAQRNVKLGSTADAYAVKAFYISGVADDRSAKTDVGTVHSSGRNEDLQIPGGLAKAIEQYIAANVRQDRSQPAIELRIKKLDCDVRRKSSYWHIECSMNFAFYYEGQMLVEYDGGSRGDMDTDPAEYAAKLIRQTLDGDLKKFDTWWGQNKAEVPTSQAVKVNFTIGTTIKKPDHIVYSPHRPLSISDFKGRARENGVEVAETSSGNEYGYSAVTENGQIVVNYIITPYFYTSDSWFIQTPDNAEVLAHEQLHFDITALKTCELISRLRTMTFTKNNYRAQLDAIPDQLARETSQMQEQYDAEGNHGLNRKQQLMWEAKVKDLLAKVDCYR